MSPRVLIACEFSGVVRDAFLRRGIETYSCDILDSEPAGHPWHVKGDVVPLLQQQWDLVIAHPPCTYLCNSGVRWLHEREDRWNLMKAGAEFFKIFMNLPHIPRVCIENPIMHKYAKEIIGQNYTQIVQPWMFGHREQKATCFWLKGLPELEPTDIVGPPPKVKTTAENKEWNRLHMLGASKGRGHERSKTYTGIAEAMAAQWAPLLDGHLCECGYPSVFNEVTQLYVGCCKNCIPF